MGEPNVNYNSKSKRETIRGGERQRKMDETGQEEEIGEGEGTRWDLPA